MMPCLALSAAVFLAVRDVPTGYVETVVGSGLSRPVALTILPDGRALVGEQYTGIIRMIRNGALLATPYATLSPVQTSNNETGLLGLCIDPNFAVNGYVYAFVTQSSTVQRIWRFTTSGDTGTGATLIVDNVPTRGVNHNGGGIGFGPDGRLYVAVGDNAISGDAPLTTTWRGKILRFTSAGGIPADNPTAGSAIWTRGHRHPFRFTWQAGTNKMFCTENGPSTNDEINVIRAGLHYGWDASQISGPRGNASYVDPMYTFTTTIAITDILFYRSTRMPFTGQMFYVDYKNDRIRRMTLGGVNGETVLSGPTDFVTLVDQPVDVEEAPDGSLWYCTFEGVVYRAEPVAGNQAPTATFTASPLSGPPTLLVNVNASGSSDPDGTIASYAWSWGDGAAGGSGVTASHTYSAAGTYVLRLTVTDNQGAVGTSSRDIVVTAPGNTPPSAHIEDATPTGGAAPQPVSFTGHGHDTAGPLQHRWDFGDGAPMQTFTGLTLDANSVVAHTYASPGTYTCTLRVTDPGALWAENQVTIVVSVPPPGIVPGDGEDDSRKCGLVGLEALLAAAALGAVRQIRRTRAI